MSSLIVALLYKERQNSGASIGRQNSKDKPNYQEDVSELSTKGNAEEYLISQGDCSSPSTVKSPSCEQLDNFPVSGIKLSDNSSELVHVQVSSSSPIQRGETAQMESGSHLTSAPQKEGDELNIQARQNDTPPVDISSDIQPHGSDVKIDADPGNEHQSYCVDLPSEDLP